MEDRPKPVIDSAVKSEQSSDLSRQRLENIQMRWQRFRAGGSFFETEDDDSSETVVDKKEKSEKRNNRFSKIGSFVRRLSGRDKPETTSEQPFEAQKPDLEHSRWFGLPPIELTDRPARTLGQEFDPPQPPEPHEPTTAEVPDTSSEDKPTTAEVPETMASSEPPEKPPEPPDAPRFGEAEEPPESPRPSSAEYFSGVGSGRSVAAAPPLEREIIRERHTVERVPRRERAGVWALAGVVWENFSRRRGERRLDRKHGRAERRIEDQVKRLHQRVDNQARVTHEQPWPVPAVRAEARPASSVEHAKPAVESKPLPWMSQPKAERAPMPRPVAEQIVRAERLETRETPEQMRVERLTAPEAYHLRPDQLQHEVEEAIKKKMAVEAIYERRHEVKDATPVGAQPIGASFGGSHQPLQPLSQPQRTLSSQPKGWQPQGLLEEETASSRSHRLYSSAIKAGFGAALIIVAVIVVILLLT